MCYELVWSVQPCCSGRPQAAIKAAAPFGGALGLHVRGVAQFRSDRHSLGGEYAASLQLPVFVLLQQHFSLRVGDGSGVGEDDDHPGLALDFFLKSSLKTHLHAFPG